MDFEKFGLDPWINAGIKAAGYTQPTPIQDRAIPHVLAGRDLLGLAQTGTGKTAAFLLPILDRLLDGELGRPRALIVAPTRELAEQIYQAALVLGRKTDLRCVALYGGVSKIPQIKALRAGVEIAVACPGRLLDHLQEGDIDLSQVEVLVLDEADHMFDMGFLPDIRRILKQLPERRQNLFFSATMPPDICALAKRVLQDPVTVEVDASAPAKTVSHALYPTTDGLRKELLQAILRKAATGRVLIFTRTKHRAHSLAKALDKLGHRVSALQGNMTQPRRQAAIDGFRSGKYDILVATDIAARGIDISQIAFVINYDMPDTVDAYTHRIGRTGRASLSGEAFTLATAADESLVRRVEQVLGARIERRRLGGFDYGDFSPEQVGQRAGGRSAANFSARPRAAAQGLPAAEPRAAMKGISPAEPRRSLRPKRASRW